MWRFKNFFKYLILMALIFWPLIHISLVSLGNINSWKLGGWGMYATTSPKRLKLKTIFIRKGIDTLPNIKIKLNKEGDSFILRKDKGLYSASSLALTQKEHFRLGKMSQYVRIMPNLNTIKSYVSFKEKVLEKLTKQHFSSAVFFLSERRFSLKKLVSFFKTKVFVYQDGDISFLGTFSGQHSTELKMIQSINDGLLRIKKMPTTLNI